MNDDDLELAGAVADGLATDEERQRVEADADLRALAAQVNALSAAVRDVPPPAERTRAAALTAAFAALDAGPDERVVAAAVQAPTNVVSLATRRRLRLVSALGTAAAVAVLAIGGVVISRRSGDDAADKAPSARAAATTDAAPAAPTTIAPATTVATMAAPAPTVAATGAQTMEVAVATAVAADAAASQALPAAGGALPELTSTSDLRAAAAAMTPAPPDADDALAACADGSLVADALYAIDGVPHPVAVVALPAAGRIGAVDVERCVIVVSAPR